jgi:hypothetical protein
MLLSVADYLAFILYNPETFFVSIKKVVIIVQKLKVWLGIQKIKVLA